MSNFNKENIKQLIAGIEEMDDAGDDIVYQCFMHEMVQKAKHNKIRDAI